MALKRFAAATFLGILFGVLSGPTSAEVVRAVEYFHPQLEHYFVTANPAEIAALDAMQTLDVIRRPNDYPVGFVYSGWWRTGQRYRIDDAPAQELVPVCRFFTSAFAQKATHFYTAWPAECDHLKSNPDWTYEGVAFYARLPDAEGACGAGTAAIHRMYNNGSGGAPNHAYTGHSAKRDALEGAGWIAEGVAYCTPLSAEDPLTQVAALAGSTWDLPLQLSLYGPLRVQTQFRASFNAQDTFAGFGYADPMVAIYHANRSGVWTGAAAWDALAGTYVLIGSSGFDGQQYKGQAWTFDGAQASATPVCAATVFFNLGVAPDFPLHAFQPYLWSGCEPGIAYSS